MFEFLFTVLILLHGNVIGTMTVQTRTAEMCADLQHSMVEDSEHIPASSPIQTYVTDCQRRTET